jgi:hypothetical protein
MRSHYLSNRVYKDYDHVFDATGEAWNAIDPDRFKTLCHESWLERAG